MCVCVCVCVCVYIYILVNTLLDEISFHKHHYIMSRENIKY